MPVTLSKIANKSASVAIPFDEDILTLEYYPNLVTQDVLLRLQKISASSQEKIAEDFQSYNHLMLTLIKSWDFLEDDGHTLLPLTEENFAHLGFAIQGKMLTAIMEDIQRPNVKTPQTNSSF